MRVELPFGRSLLGVEVPDDATVLRPRPVPPLADAAGAVRAALRRPTAGPPLRERVGPGQRVAIVISDLTRPVPNRLMLPCILEELAMAGIREADVTIVNGTGLHRPNTRAELEEMLGRELLSRFRVVQHEARRPETLVRVGVASDPRGVPIELCRAYVEADARVVTGFVEPHLFAGYSGGAKGVMPGVAGGELIMSNHGAANLAHPKARWCVAAGNPVFEEMRSVVALCPPDFLLNVTLDGERRVTGVYGGDLEGAHDAAIAQADRQHRIGVRGPFDVVLATNMGYPADTTLYQSVKGMSVAAEAVREGGDIVLVAGCEEGLGGPEYREFLQEGESPAALLDAIRSTSPARHDQWQIQCQAMVQAKASVHLFSRLSRAETEAAHLSYVDDVSETVDRLLARARERGRQGSLLVLPNGQLTVPVVEG
jgi:nickel-dependent lactate racemase